MLCWGAETTIATVRSVNSPETGGSLPGTSIHQKQCLLMQIFREAQIQKCLREHDFSMQPSYHQFQPHGNWRDILLPWEQLPAASAMPPTVLNLHTSFTSGQLQTHNHSQFILQFIPVLPNSLPMTQPSLKRSFLKRVFFNI